MRKTAPATDVANSHRKNSAPRSKRSLEGQGYHGVPRGSDCLGVLVRFTVVVPLHPGIDEHPVIAVTLGVDERLVRYGDQAFPLFAGALGKELLRP